MKGQHWRQEQVLLKELFRWFSLGSRGIQSFFVEVSLRYIRVFTDIKQMFLRAKELVSWK